MEEKGELPEETRMSWSTAQRIVKEGEQEDGEDVGDDKEEKGEEQNADGEGDLSR